MPLKNYGLLTGRLADHGTQAGDNPHCLLVVQAGAIPYRVSFNVQSTSPRQQRLRPAHGKRDGSRYLRASSHRLSVHKKRSRSMLDLQHDESSSESGSKRADVDRFR
jgi:hypothetical protein